MSGIRIAGTSQQVEELVRQWRESGLTVGFVPTMGALHRGHISLVELALAETDRVVVSIFVNPAQFGPGEDLDSYPRTVPEDIDSLDGAGAHCVFLPAVSEIYPPGHSTTVKVSGLPESLCGRFRKGHFEGVTTVCAILFGIVRPDAAVFGKKDAQQLAVIRRMVRDLRLGVRIVAGDTVREPDGLAMSSRNAYLGKEERIQAAVIHRALAEASAYVGSGGTGAEKIIETARSIIREAPLARIQYIELVDPETMEPIRSLNPHGLLAVAVYFGDTRLIDNVTLETRGL
ncbi:MAG: pantoate--beta-alanine ligase [Candidatus Fermentibacteraceae bacterium]|nr:pantoate--beta-alanine ligase [Candidatus Fermentibacteraceae bacterium]